MNEILKANRIFSAHGEILSAFGESKKAREWSKILDAKLVLELYDQEYVQGGILRVQYQDC